MLAREIRYHSSEYTFRIFCPPGVIGIRCDVVVAEGATGDTNRLVGRDWKMGS